MVSHHRSGGKGKAEITACGSESLLSYTVCHVFAMTRVRDAKFQVRRFCAIVKNKFRFQEFSP